MRGRIHACEDNSDRSHRSRGLVVGAIAMKQVWKIGSILVSVLVLWISLLLAPDLPRSLQLIVPYIPMYAIATLGCYGLGALGYGMMVFRVCPEEAVLLQKDIAEGMMFLKEHGFDVSTL